MIVALSWKNIWRSRRRSLVVIGATLIGVWALIFIIGFYNSFNKAFAQNAIRYEYSHLQIHHPDYLIEADPKYSVAAETALLDVIRDEPGVRSYSARMKINGMIASTKTSLGIQIYGINPDQEAHTTQLADQLVDGDYFAPNKRSPILISTKLADKLKVKIRSKVVITFQDFEGHITAAACRIEGIFDSKSKKINDGVIYMLQSDLQQISGIKGIQEVAVLLQDVNQMEVEQNKLKSLTVNTVRTYKEVAPEFNLMEQSSTITKQLLTVIIMLALLFGLINTMLMVVLERTREIGMLRAVGMHRRSIFSMIIMETSMMGVLGGPLGLFLGYLTIKWLGKRGMDLSLYADALREFGFDTVFYPEIQPTTYWLLLLVVFCTALIGAIYPAIKAIRLNPLEAIRKL